MPNIIKPKRSTVASSVPTTADLQDGEMAVNIADKKIYIRSGSEIIELANFSGGGGGVLYPKYEVFTASGTFTLPSTAAAMVEYDLIGGGGGGARYTNGSAGGGGGGERIRGSTMLTPGTGYSVVVGAAGVGTPGNKGDAGGNGGDSVFAGVTARGGKGGAASGAIAYGGTSGAGVIPPLAAVLDTSAAIVYNPIVCDSAPGGSVVNVTGGGAMYYVLGGGIGNGGVCSGGGAYRNSNVTGGVYAGGPGAGNGSNLTDVDGRMATAPGCGGGGSGATTGGIVGAAGGNGFRGEVRITYWDTVL